VNFRDKRQLNSFQSLVLLRVHSTEDLNERLFQLTFGQRPPRRFASDEFIWSEGWFTFRSFSTLSFERGARQSIPSSGKTVFQLAVPGVRQIPRFRESPVTGIRSVSQYLSKISEFT
jgi:hypothetical protein